MTKTEKQVIREMAERCAGVAPGERNGRWTHEDRVAIIYSVVCSIINLNNKKNVESNKNTGQ